MQTRFDICRQFWVLGQKLVFSCNLLWWSVFSPLRFDQKTSPCVPVTADCRPLSASLASDHCRLQTVAGIFSQVSNDLKMFLVKKGSNSWKINWILRMRHAIILFHKSFFGKWTSTSRSEAKHLSNNAVLLSVAITFRNLVRSTLRFAVLLHRELVK